jgi:hypothetical protein
MIGPHRNPLHALATRCAGEGRNGQASLADASDHGLRVDTLQSQYLDARGGADRGTL